MHTIKWDVKAETTSLEEGYLERLEKILLTNRGISSKEAPVFFNPIHPHKIPIDDVGINKTEVKKALDRIAKAIESHEKVIVYGDYDADGVCATSVLWETLWKTGVDALPYIPERLSEGYGMKAESIKGLKDKYSNLGLIITADNGIVAHKEIVYARSIGIDVIVTDHHEPTNKAPGGLAVIHTTQISGAGVAWFLSREIHARFAGTKTVDPDLNLDIAVIGCISDQIPLLGVNRSLVVHGLAALRKTNRVGLLAIFRVASIDPAKTGIYEINYGIAPRINAMGRLTHALDSVRILCTRNALQAASIADTMNQTNLARQDKLSTLVTHIEDNGVISSDGVVVAAHASYHEGIIGLAASKLVEKYFRPSIVFSINADIAKASARSIPGFNIIEAVRYTSDLLIDGGGHEMAAGFTIKASDIDVFIRKINEYATPRLTQELLTRKMIIDARIPLSIANTQLYSLVAKFEPTGIGNPTAVFTTSGVRLLSPKIIGRDGKHLKVVVEQDGVTCEAVGFSMADRYSSITPDTHYDIAYCVDLNEWNGTKQFQLKLKDLH